MPQLLFVHRWIGVVLAIFMLGWFSSGLIIANTGALSVSRERQVSHAQALQPEAGWLSLGAALERSASPAEKRAPVADARLARRGGEPVWLVETETGQRLAVSALDGKLKQFSAEDAERIARDWFAAEGGAPALTHLDTIDTAPGLRNAEGLKPFHRIAVEDGAGTIVIVSSRTGDVLQAAPRTARAINFVGNWLHLFRPLDLLGAGDYRRDALTYAGFFAFIGAVTGVVIGFIKWKPGFFGRPTYARGRTQPYRETWLKYHFWAGLIGGIFALIWAGSGFLSTNPGQIFSPATPSREELVRYRGGDMPALVMDWRPGAEAGTEAVELRWGRLGDDAVLLAQGRDGAPRPLRIVGAREGFDDVALLAAAQRLAQQTPIAGSERIAAYDSYYFAGHGGGASERPLPALRVDLADAGKTSLYLDPQDGRLLLRIDNSRRAYRWLYSAVHHWDFGWFQHAPLARRGWISLWAALGLVLATSAVVLAWRRLRRSLPERAVAPQKAAPARA